MCSPHHITHLPLSGNTDITQGPVTSHHDPMSSARGSCTGAYSDSFTAMAMLPITRSNGHVTMVPLYICIYVGIVWSGEMMLSDGKFILYFFAIMICPLDWSGIWIDRSQDAKFWLIESRYEQPPPVRQSQASPHTIMTQWDISTRGLPQKSTNKTLFRPRDEPSERTQRFN